MATPSKQRPGKPTSIDIFARLDGTGSGSSSPPTPLTPKTPAEEGLEFFGSAVKPGEGPIKVYELRLSEDGGPSKDLQVGYPLTLIEMHLIVSSTSASLLRTRPTSSASRSKRGRPHPRTVSSRPTFRWMGRPSAGNGTSNARACSCPQPVSPPA